ncbi:MAG: DNA-directed RNA polymerase subunit K [Thermoprotei archaeon]
MEKNTKKSFFQLTKYEKTRILGARALQLSLGAPALLPKADLQGKSELQIAEMELNSGVLPMVIYRKRPNGEVEVISLSSPQGVNQVTP